MFERYLTLKREPIVFINNIKIPDIETIAVMKLELMLRRSKKAPGGDFRGLKLSVLSGLIYCLTALTNMTVNPEKYE